MHRVAEYMLSVVHNGTVKFKVKKICLYYRHRRSQAGRSRGSKGQQGIECLVETWDPGSHGSEL